MKTLVKQSLLKQAIVFSQQNTSCLKMTSLLNQSCFLLQDLKQLLQVKNTFFVFLN